MGQGSSDNNIEKPMVRCNECDCGFIPEVVKSKRDDLELTFFSCPYCGSAYLLSVTDEALRKSVREYKGLYQRNKKKRLTEKTQRRMQKLKTANIKRCKELQRLFMIGLQEQQEKRERTEHPETEVGADGR